MPPYSIAGCEPTPIPTSPLRSARQVLRPRKGDAAVLPSTWFVLLDRIQDEPHKLRHGVTLDPPRNDNQVVDRVYVNHVDA